MNEIYLFDDIFSSLDAHVADSIFEKAIIGYLIKERHATVVLVTSHYHFLSNSHLNLNNQPSEEEKNNDKNLIIAQKEKILGEIFIFENGTILRDIIKKEEFMK